MSERKSWDIQRKPAKAASPAPLPAPLKQARKVGSMRDMHPTAKKLPEAAPVRTPVRDTSMARGVKKRPESPERLKKRRARMRRILGISLALLLVIVVVGTFYLSWQPFFRIHTVVATGPDADSSKQIAEARIQGTHFRLVPRNSLFFIPESEIRADILAAHPDVEAVSLAAPDLHTLAITTIPRASAFWWCGVSKDAEESCYATNAEGFVFAPVDTLTASSSGMLLVYAPIDGNALSPLRAHVEQAIKIPDVLRLVKALRGLGADVISVAFRGDEADLYTTGHTRIVFVLGREEASAALAATAFPTFDLNDGSLEYVDLRFDGKVYFKKRGE